MTQKIAKIIFKRNKSGGLKLPDIKTEATVIKKHSIYARMDKQNHETETLGKNTHVCWHLTYDKVTLQSDDNEESLFTK